MTELTDASAKILGESVADSGGFTEGDRIAAAPQVEALEDVDRRRESAWQWLKRQQLKVALGGVAVSSVVSFTSEFHTVEHQLVEAGPWIGSTLAGAEVTWIGSAAVMLAAIGSKIGNPLKIRDRVPEILQNAANTPAFKAAFAINIAASMAETGVATEAISQLPPETWGYLTLPAWNLATDFMLIGGMRRSLKRNSAARDKDSPSVGVIEEAPETGAENEKQPNIRVRRATIADAARISEIDLSRYKRVYGKNPPSQEENIEIFSKAISNAGPDYTYVCEVDGKVEGLVNAFRTNKRMEDFISWEDCTADMTLEGRVDPKGQYVYAANLTVNPEAMKYGGEDMLVANLMAQAIKDGIEYGYFCSRMPLFSAWVRRQIREGRVEENLSAEELDDLANYYVNSKEIIDGEEVRIDHELRMYEGMGFELGRVVRNGFQDPQSLSYGVLCKVEVPPKGIAKKSKLVRLTMAKGLRVMARHPKLLERFFA